MWPVLLYLFIYLTRAEDVPTDPCHSHHALGLETLIRTSGPIAMAETESIRLRYHKALRYTFSKLERKAKRAQAPDDGPVGSSTMGSTTVSSNSGSTMPGASTTEGSTTGGSTTTAFVPTTASDWNPNCPRPNATMFTVAPPTTNVHFTQPITTPASSTAGSTPEASTTAGSTMTSDSSKTASTQSPPTTTAGFASTNGGKGFQPVPLYMDHEEDPLVVHFNRLHKYVTRPEAACDVQNITTLNDLTEDHLYGFVASLVTTDVGPFCSVCHRMVNEVKKRAFVISALLHDEEQQLMGKIFHSHIPSTKTICSALAPACFEKYEEKVKKVSPGLLCAECSACMTVTNVIQHRLLLNPTVVQSLFSFLRSSLFHNICAELCNSLNNKQADLQGLWPNGFQYGACQDWFQTQFNGIIKFVTTLTRPERFCSLELGWCELNEVPNMLQCLPEFCEEFLGKNAVIKVICKLLVGKNQQEAAEFIGVSNTKRYKEKKEYHDQITVHEEL